MGVANEVPPHVVYALSALVTSFSVRSPVADHPTATKSGSNLLTEFGPRFDQDADSPQVLPFEEKAPTEMTPWAPPGEAVVPYPWPPLPTATKYVVSGE